MRCLWAAWVRLLAVATRLLLIIIPFAMVSSTARWFYHFKARFFIVWPSCGWEGCRSYRLGRIWNEGCILCCSVSTGDGCYVEMVIWMICRVRGDLRIRDGCSAILSLGTGSVCGGLGSEDRLKSFFLAGFARFAKFRSVICLVVNFWRLTQPLWFLCIYWTL